MMNRNNLPHSYFVNMTKEKMELLINNGLAPSVADMLIDDLPNTVGEIMSLGYLNDIELYLYNYMMTNKQHKIYPYRRKINELCFKGLELDNIARLINGMPYNFTDIDELHAVYENESDINYNRRWDKGDNE